MRAPLLLINNSPLGHRCPVFLSPRSQVVLYPQSHLDSSVTSAALQVQSWHQKLTTTFWGLLPAPGPHPSSAGVHAQAHKSVHQAPQFIPRPRDPPASGVYPEASGAFSEGLPLTQVHKMIPSFLMMKSPPVAKLPRNVPPLFPTKFLFFFLALPPFSSIGKFW